MKVFVNATAAKSGGALTILNSFIESRVKDKSNYYIVMSPFEPKVKPDNVYWVRKRTTGINTLIFTAFLSWFYCKFYKCEKIISFSNVNTIFPVKYKVSYFHNLLILTGSNIKYRILRNMIRFFNKQSCQYIVQTSFVKDSFFSTFGNEYDLEVCWPGISANDGVIGNSLKSIVSSAKNVNKTKFLIPITDINLDHKNFELVLKIRDCLAENNIVFFVTSASDFQIDNIEFIGNMDRESYLALLEFVDATLITSTFETLCLPIFESLVKNKPVYVYDAPYLKGLFNDFGEIPGLIPFSSEIDLTLKLCEDTRVDINLEGYRYIPGNWNF